MLETIYVTRHGFRSNWVVDPKTGEYSASVPSPTGIPSDPALAGYGVLQAEQLAKHLVTLDPPIQRFYSSPFYRCIQTLSPTITLLTTSPTPPFSTSPPLINGEPGLGEWYGTARFDHPSPAPPSLLHTLFPCYSLSYAPKITPSSNGESIASLHDRVAYALSRIIEDCDRDGDVKALCICTHAATLIAIGRALTGRMPRDSGEQDFRPFTCGLSRFERRRGHTTTPNSSTITDPHTPLPLPTPDNPIPSIAWRDGNGVAGGWDCVVNGDCGFLEGGEERGWRFSGDEAFDVKIDGKKAVDAGELGVVVEGKGRGNASGGSEAKGRL